MRYFTPKGIFAATLLLISLVAQAQEPGGQPTGVTAVTQNGTTIRVSWTPGAAPLPTHYLVQARVVPDGTFITVADTDPNNALTEDLDLGDDNLGAHSVPVGTNLYDFPVVAEKNYEFRVYPYNSTGNDFKTNGTVILATASTKKPSVQVDPTNPVTGIAETTGTIHAEVTATNGNAITHRGTIWSYNTPIPAGSNELDDAANTVGTFTRALTSLNMGVPVYYKAYATNAAGTTFTNEEVFYTIAEAPANQIPAFTATALSATSIRLNFTPISGNGARTAGYIILRRINADPEDNDAVDGVDPALMDTDNSVYIATITNTGQTTYTDDTPALTPDTKYHYAVVPYNIVGANFATINYKVGTTFTKANATTFSKSSNIVLNGGDNGTVASIDYQANPPVAGAGPNLSQGNTLGIAKFIIQDGGGSNDADGLPTVVTSISINIDNWENVHSIGLFDDDANSLMAEWDDITTGALTFTLPSPITVADNGVFRINFRATFRRVVIDNEQIHIAISSAITSGTVNSSLFAASNAGGATTTGAANKIAVVATKLIFISPPTPTSRAVNTAFDLKVQAVDEFVDLDDDITYNNRDMDYNKSVTIFKSSGNSAMTPTNQKQKTFASGEFTWTGSSAMSISTVGTFTITAREDGSGSPPQGQTSITIASAPAAITLSNNSICYGATFHKLNVIKIKETDNAGFTTGNDVTITLALPAGFVFDQTKETTGFTIVGPDISKTGNSYNYTQTNVVEIKFSINGTTGIDELILDDLYVSATHPNTMTVSQISGPIIRQGGTAVISGDAPGESHGSVTANLGSTPSDLGFTVVKVNNGDPLVNANETRFSVSGAAVRLSGTPPGSPTPGSFFGSGVSPAGSDYRFTPSSLATGAYTISYKVTNGGCDFVHSKSFEVYASQITNLEPQYCNNDDPSLVLSVSRAVINANWGTTYNLSRFVYWNLSAPAPLLDVNRFNPARTEYQSIYPLSSPFQGPGIYIGWIAEQGGVETFPLWVFIPVKSAPVPLITISKTNFCADDQPITLTGSPPNSNDAGVDHFDVPTAQNGSVTSSNGTPKVWTFTPSLAGSTPNDPPVQFSMVYEYRNPSTGCSARSAPVTIKVSPRPTAVPQIDITANRTQQVCQGGTAAVVTARPVNGTTYTWYADEALTLNGSVTGDSFTPPTNTVSAGITNFFVTRTINGCESNRETVSPPPPRPIELKVNATPGPPVTNFTQEYCAEQLLNATHFQILGGSGIKWYSESMNFLLGGATPTLSEIQNALGVSTAVAKTYIFNVTQTANNCEGLINPTKMTVLVKPRPVLTITPDNAPNQICKTDPILTLSAFDQGLPATLGSGTGVWTGISAIVGNPGTGTAEVDPDKLNPGLYTIQFAFTNDATTCSNTKTVSLRVKPTITPKLEPLDSCEKLFVRINNKSKVFMGSLAEAEPLIVTTQWNFGDGTGLPAGNGPIDDGRTRKNFFDPEHLFTSTGTFQMQYTMTTAQGCVVTGKRQLQVNPKPNAFFGWKDACMNTISSTQFLATTIPVLPIDDYNWDFTRTSTLSYNTAGSGVNPTVTYNTAGRDSVRLIVTTNAQCKDTVRHPIFIVPAYAPIDIDNSYTQDFDGGSDGWIDGGENSSWEVGKPNETIQTVGPNNFAWDTNLDGTSNIKEQSYVLSPCFDLTGADKPIISMDIWSDTPTQNDGAVLQYNEDGNLLNDASWKVLGVIGSGSNWYSESGISSSPGSQADTDMGWTGSYDGWRHAAYKLDILKGKENLVFRIAFASNAPRRDGFAFDNIFIGERTRTVLLENFTNSSAAANTKVHNDFFRTFSNNSNEISKVEYHTAFPGHDPINAMNTAINGSRAAFYGISSTGTFTLDGQVAGNAANLQSVYDDRVLTPSPFRIDITQVKDGPVVKISTTITNITNLTLPVSKANVFTVLVEKSITQDGMLGSNGDTEFVYVARKMMPTAAGVRIGRDIGPMESITLPDLTWDEVNLLNSSNGAIVVFIQNTEGDNKNVFQSAIVNATVIPDITTGNELQEQVEGIRLYPNPVNGEEVTISLPEKAKRVLPVTLLDAQGRNMLSTSIAKGNDKHTLTTSSLSNGVYIVEIETDKGRVVRKKITVMH